MDTARVPTIDRLGSIIFFLLLSLLLAGCAAAGTAASGAEPAASDLAEACPVTEPVWAKPPEDSAVQGTPGYGYYYINEDRSIWASAWWAGQGEEHLTVSEEGAKVGWFRPEGADLEVTGQRIDGEAPPLEFHAPCCYPTRFQASGLYFPAPGCWEVTARAAGSELTFVVKIEP